MRFDTYIPTDRLKPWVESFAVQETGAESLYKVLPGTGLVIGFQFRGRLSRIEDEKTIALSTAGITGLNDSFRIFKNEANTGTVLVFFKEAGAAAFFKQPLHELFRESISLDNFMLRSELLIIEEQLCEAKDDAGRIKVVEQFLTARLIQAVPDTMVLKALALIHKTRGIITIKELMKELHTSQSPLEKRFRQAVGTSPKKFASIVRLKHLIEQYKPGDTLTGLGYEAGFYDQAHFIKEFKIFTGETPGNFFGSMK
ncbi:MAG: helix-turn-helix domain-containing protein [Ferruginibacter sp.]